MPISGRASFFCLLHVVALASVGGCRAHTTGATAVSASAPPPSSGDDPEPSHPGGAPPPASTAPPRPAPAAHRVTHPAYVRALSDLRSARWNLERKGGDAQMKWDEHGAIQAIDRAIDDIKQAAIEDGKSIADHPPADTHEPRIGRLHKAIDALRTARDNVHREEDNATARALKGRALREIDQAIRFTEQGIRTAEHAI